MVGKVNYLELYQKLEASMNRPMSDGRKRAIAKRCQLLTGSHLLSSTACCCRSRHECRLSEVDRCELAATPEVIAAREKNFQEYQSTNER